jgi:WhiB family transcriptional regulator, redox-sensing transcriptional regulator
MSNDWREKAACKNSKLDFFDSGNLKQKRELCATCPVINECYEYALYNELYGFWGGESEWGRQQIRKARKIPNPGYASVNIFGESRFFEISIEHGTESGYISHVRNRIPMDQCSCGEFKNKIAETNTMD